MSALDERGAAIVDMIDSLAESVTGDLSEFVLAVEDRDWKRANECATSAASLTRDIERLMDQLDNLGEAD